MKNRITLFIPAIFLILFFYVPVLSVLSQSNLNTLFTILKTPYYIHIIKFTLSQALLSALLSVIIGFPGAYILRNYNFRGKKTVENIYSIPFILPSIIVVLGFVILYGKNGYINKLLGTDIKFLYRTSSVLASHVFYNFPVAVSIISSYWKTLDQDLENFAYSTGLGKTETFFKVTLKRLLPSVANAFTLIFLMCFSSFAIILVLGGGPKLTSLEVEIYRQAKISLDIPKASTLAIISMMFSSVFLIINNFFSNRAIKEKINNYIPYKKMGLLSKIYLILSCLFIVLPLLSLFSKGLTFNKTNVKCIVNTLVLALFVASSSTIISLLLARVKSRISDILITLPLAVSSIILGLGYYLLKYRLGFISSFVLVAFAHIVICLPFCYRTIKAAYDSLPVTYIENAQSLGATKVRIMFEIELRAIKNNLASAFMFAFALSCGEINSTLILGDISFTTIPVQMYRYISSYNYSLACTLGCILCIICIVVNSVKLKILNS